MSIPSCKQLKQLYKQHNYAQVGLLGPYDTIRDAILTCARKPTKVSLSLIYRTEPTTKKVLKQKKSKKTDMLRSRPNSKQSRKSI